MQIRHSQIQWNLGLRTPWFTFVSVYARRFVENVALVYVQTFSLQTLIEEFRPTASWGVQRGGINLALGGGFSSSASRSRDRFMKENILIVSKKRKSLLMY